MKSALSGFAITDVVGVIPRTRQHFDDEICNYSHSAENSARLKATMGYGEHRIEEGTRTASDYASAGFRALVEANRLDPEQVDALIFVSQTPDYVLPPTSAVLHGEWSLPQSCVCYDINDGCAGFIKGLHLAASLFSTGSAKLVLLVTGDVLSKKVSVHDRNSYPLLGDAVCVSIVRQSETGPVPFELCTNGAGHGALIVPAGGARLPASPETSALREDDEGNRRSKDHLVMRGRDVFTFTQTVIPEFIDEFITASGFDRSKIEFFFLHQANAFILDRLRRKFGLDQNSLPDAVVRKYGNSSSATIPLSIAERFTGTDLPGQKIALLCGFGVGLSWGAALVELGELDFTEILEI
jgi:3-oxoacyl-[acyl-carrier-protein] synthase-3